VLQPGAIVGGKFQIERVLGAGGMGVVAVAMHLQLDQRVALKVLHAEAAANPETVQRFLREARAAAKLKSEHICKVTDVGQLETGAPYIVMELLEGGDLASVLARGPMAPQLAIDTVVQACVGLAEAHSYGIVHRDLKPANLFVTRRLDGTALVKILDFGIAKTQAGAASGLTQTSMVMGTPGYMAPEQLRSTKDADARADVWALGVILYQALSGRLPFPANSITEFAVKTAMEPPDPIDLEPGLRAIVMRCLEKDPAARFPDVASLAQALAPYGGLAARANAQLAATLLGPQLGHAATVMTGAQQVPTTLQVASGVAAPTAARPARSGVLLGAGLLAAAVLGGVVVVAATSKHDQPPAPVAAVTPPPAVHAAVPAAVDAGAWPALIDAAQVAAVEPPVAKPSRPAHPHVSRAPQPEAKASEVAPFVPPAAPAQPSDPDKAKAFDKAIATRHCQRALTLAQSLTSSGPQYMQQVTACMNARTAALQDYSSPATEPWIIALADDMADMGKPDIGAQQLDGYYYARGAKACQAKDAGQAKAMYAKVKSATLRTPFVQVCKAFQIALP
jgi:eukaryotic-like serine/threonine-protein kinase